MVASMDGATRRFELKLVSFLRENRWRLQSALRSTRAYLESKRLDYLLLLTVSKRVLSTERGFIKDKDYCILGILVSDSKIRSVPPKDLAEDILEEVEKHLEGDEVLYGISHEQLLEHSEGIAKLEIAVMDLEETVHELLGQSDGLAKLEIAVVDTQEKIDSLEKVVVTKDSFNKLDGKVDDIKGDVDGLKENVNDVKEDLSKLQEIVSSLQSENRRTNQKIDQIISLLENNLRKE